MNGLPALLVLRLLRESGSGRNGSNLTSSVDRTRTRDFSAIEPFSGDFPPSIAGSITSEGIGDDRSTKRGSNAADFASETSGSALRCLRMRRTSNIAGVCLVLSPKI